VEAFCDILSHLLLTRKESGLSVRVISQV